LSKLIKEIYNDPAYNTSGDSWKIPSGSTNYNDPIIGKTFTKMMDSIKQFQAEKLKKGIHYAFKTHL